MHGWKPAAWTSRVIIFAGWQRNGVKTLKKVLTGSMGLD
jgi:hypothetical protein